MKVARSFGLLITLLITFSLSANAILLEEFVFNDPPFKSCHASTLTENTNKEILCSWFARTKEGENDLFIWRSHKKRESSQSQM